MALFAAIGDRFVAKILKQVANDYNLDFEEMKTRYCGKSSFELMVPTKQVEVDLEDPDRFAINSKTPEPESDTEIVPAPKAKKKASKPKEPKEDTSKKLMALSKMKKPDLVAECEERGLDSEGTVAQLKERVKEARESESPAAPKAAKKPAAKKEKVAKETKEKKAPSKKKVAPPPPPPPEPLEEELEEEDVETDGEEEPDSPGGVRAKMLREAKEFEEEPEEEEEDLQARLRKILAEAEEEEFEDEMEETQVV